MKKNCLFLFLPLLFLVSCSGKQSFRVPGVAEPIVNLNGTWKIHYGSYEDIVTGNHDVTSWKEVTVPGEPMMQGFPVKHDRPFLYSREVAIPADFRGKSVRLRFEGVYSYARVWINNSYVRDHSGGFTPWECDITAYVKPGEKAALYVEVTDRADEISYASGYAKHQIGGILRNVSLLALPDIYPEKLSVTTDFDEKFVNATLAVRGVLNDGRGNHAVRLALYDPAGKEVRLETRVTDFSGNTFELINSVSDPLKWDAEHPNLYTLRISFLEKGKETWEKELKVGFREIEIRGNRFLVNGQQVKLRGACRHDIHPMLGRMATSDYDLKDVLLAKEANMNFIRTSHYPPDEKFLEACDRYGIYVEDETAVCFVGSHRTAEYYPGNSESSADYTERYLSQLQEMVDNHRNHPCIIMWSIGNENTFGTNFLKSYEWVKSADPTRPVIYSYPGQVPDSVRAFDVISMHYPGTNGTMEQYGLRTNGFSHPDYPVIFDEWAHVPCYNQETVMSDPNVRDFWGITLDSMWQGVYEAEGGLGGAIWGMIDETFMLPVDLPGYNEWWGKLDKNVIPAKFSGHTIGYGEWGIIDTWRRKKPEFWSVKKAYSPVRLLHTEQVSLVNGVTVEIPVYNRFDFSSLNEIRLTVTEGDKSLNITMPDVKPHSVGMIRYTPAALTQGQEVKFEFFDSHGNLIDMYVLKAAGANEETTAVSGSGTADISEDAGVVTVSFSNGSALRIDRNTGLFTSFLWGGRWRSFSGPSINYLILGSESSYSAYSMKGDWGGWKQKQFSLVKEGDSVIINSSGNYGGNIDAEYRTVISFPGKVVTTYNFSNLPNGYVRESGIRFTLEDAFDTLRWNRDTYWKGYPEGHLSAAEGRVPLYAAGARKYREAPTGDWESDRKSFFYNGTDDEDTSQLINSARSTKENVYSFSLTGKDEATLSVDGNGDKSCRLVKSGDKIDLLVNDYVDYPDIGWGDYSRNRSLNGGYSGTAVITIK